MTATPATAGRAAALRDLADELTPAHTLTTMADRAQFMVLAIGGVLGVLGGFAVSNAPWLVTTGGGRYLILPAVGLTVIAMMLAVSYFTRRLRRVNLRNLADVETFFASEMRRAVRSISWSGRLLLLSLVLVVSGAIWLLVDQREDVSLSVAITGTAKREVTVNATATGVPPGELIVVRVVDRPASGPARTLLASGLVADERGRASLTTSVRDLDPATTAVRASVTGSRGELADATADLAWDG